MTVTGPVATAVVTLGGAAPTASVAAVHAPKGKLFLASACCPHNALLAETLEIAHDMLSSVCSSCACRYGDMALR